MEESKELVTLKLYQRTHPVARSSSTNELRALAMLRHSNIIRLLGVTEITHNGLSPHHHNRGDANPDDNMAVDEMTVDTHDEQNDRHDEEMTEVEEVNAHDEVGIVIFEFYDGVPLNQFIRQHGALPEPIVVSVMCQLVSALHYMHSNGVAHRDIKSANVLISPVTFAVKLTDFGVSCSIRDDGFRTDFAGTPLNMAPEVLRGLPYDPVQADLWCLGIVVLEMLLGRHPFGCASSVSELREFQSRLDVSQTFSRHADVNRVLAQVLRSGHRGSARGIADLLRGHTDAPSLP